MMVGSEGVPVDPRNLLQSANAAGRGGGGGAKGSPLVGHMRVQASFWAAARIKQ